jgi:5'-nucleotidase
VPLRASRLLLGALAATALVAGCGDDDGGNASSDTTAAPAEETTTTTAVEPLQILVSNDDGYAAAGIAALVDGLSAIPDVEVTVVAPDQDRTGAGGSTTPEGVTATDVTMANGHPATGVSGFPADSVAYALDEMGLTPDLVVTGTNIGQNLGPVIDLSGTVGAARVAAQRGIPAVATSAGMSADPAATDYAATVAVVVQWIEDHRDDLEGATADQVVNINVPTCGVGEVRDTVEVSYSTAPLGSEALVADVDCSVTGPAPTDDVGAFNAGFATIALIPAQPA